MSKKNKNYYQSIWLKVYKDITMKEYTEPLFEYRVEIRNVKDGVDVTPSVKYKITNMKTQNPLQGVRVETPHLCHNEDHYTDMILIGKCEVCKKVIEVKK